MSDPKINWDDINHVFLDMDGTLLDLHFDNHFWLHYLPEHYAEKNGIDPSEARELLYERFTATEGTLNWYCLDYWSRELDVNIVALKREVAHLIQVHEQVIELLDELRERGKRLVLLTNAHRGSLGLKIEQTGIDGHFDRVISSHDLGLAKENPGFWDRLATLESFDVRHSLLVDDSLSVLANARHAGLAYVLAVRWPDTRQDEREVVSCASVRGVGELLNSF
jgi:HAD superfamily hydrolase (TIGR01509 family)